MFPASHRPECQEIERSLREFPKSYLYPGHSPLNLFRIDEENMNLLAEVMEGMAICFPDMDFTGVEISIDDITMQARPLRFANFA